MPRMWDFLIFTACVGVLVIAAIVLHRDGLF